MTVDQQPPSVQCAAWLATLAHRLTPWQQLVAANAYRLSVLLDDEADPVKASAASRELRQIVGLLAPTVSTGDAPERPESWSRPDEPDPIEALRDEVAAKRDQVRRAG